MKQLTQLILLLIIVASCNEKTVQPTAPEYNYTYMYFDQYDYDGLVGTKSDIIVVSPDNLRTTNSNARQSVRVGEFEEDFDNYIDPVTGETVIANDQYLSDRCWGRGDFSVASKDVTGDGSIEQVLGATIVPDGCVEASCTPDPFASAQAIDLGSENGELYLSSTYDNVKISGNPDAEDELRWLTNDAHIPVGGKVTLWADEGQTITIKHNHSSTSKIVTKSGENEVLNSGEFMVLERNDYGYGYNEVNRSTVDSIQFYSPPFNLTDDVTVKLEDLYLETDETVRVDIYLTWENGTPYYEDPVYSADLVDGLNVKPPDDSRGFYAIEVEVNDPVYVVRFHFVFTVVDTDGDNEPSSVYIDGLHVEGPSDLNGAGCGYNSLPIELVEFNSYKDDDNIRLYIETASELNADYMQFYGSMDGREWKKIDDTITCDNIAWGSKYYLVFNTRNGKMIRE